MLAKVGFAFLAYRFVEISLKIMGLLDLE